MRQLLKTNFINGIKSNKGFTLIEILVALVLVSIIVGLTIKPNFSTADNAEKESENLMRAIRYMSDEATIRNSVTRLHFLLDKNPQEYSVEYGPSDSFTIKANNEFETSVESNDDKKKKEKENKDLNLKFNKIQEFQDKNAELSEGVKIVAIGSINSDKMQTKGESSVYAFASGEKDEALIILASEESVISLKIGPFSSKIDKEIHRLEFKENDNSDLNKKIEDKAKEIFEKWKREK